MSSQFYTLANLHLGKVQDKERTRNGLNVVVQRKIPHHRFLIIINLDCIKKVLKRNHPQPHT